MIVCQNKENKENQKDQQQELKKLLPQGTCLVHQYKRYEFIKKFITDSSIHSYILPMNHVYSPFVVIKKDYQIFTNPIYQMYYHPQQHFLLAAQQHSMSIGCNFIISRQKLPQKDDNFVAKVRGNFAKNEFNIFDNGNNPEKNSKKPRKHLAFLKKQQKSFPDVKSFLMVVPKPIENNRLLNEQHKYQPVQFFCRSDSPTPLTIDLQQKSNSIEELSFKQLKSSMLEEKTIVFQTRLKSQAMMVRKRSKTYFQIEIGCPMTIVQGFGCLLAMIQAELV